MKRSLLVNLFFVLLLVYYFELFYLFYKARNGLSTVSRRSSHNLKKKTNWKFSLQKNSIVNIGRYNIAGYINVFSRHLTGTAF